MSRLLLACSLVLVGACSLATDFGRYDGRGSADDGGAIGGPNNGSDSGGSSDTGADSGDDQNGGDAGAGRLSVTVQGPGIVTGEGFECAKDTCATRLTTATMVLTAVPGADAAFDAWRGPCAEDSNDGAVDQSSASLTCTLTAGAELDVTAIFAGDRWFDLTVVRSGSGEGRVASLDGRVVCAGLDSKVCTARYVKGAVVTLTAEPEPGRGAFSGWGGACTGDQQCVLTVADNRVVDAVFNLAGYGAVIVTKPGKGRGFVSSSPEGVACGDQCSASYSLAATLPMVMLTAKADESSTFVGFTGSCAVQTDPTQCFATVDDIERVNADFAFKSFGLSVTWAGNGQGKIAGAFDDGSALTCAKPEACSKQVEFNTTVTLTPEPAAGSMFVGWSGGGCGLDPTCKIDVTKDTMVVANFAVQEHAVTLTVMGQGAVSCNGQPCAPQYVHGTSVTFSAAAAVGWDLMKWDGACAGTAVTDPCTKTITENTTVIATFAKKQYKLRVTVGGTGTGTVAGTLACDVAQKQPCTIDVTKGDPVRLTASPLGDATFAGWGGACGGTGECAIAAVSADLDITATFNKKVAGKTTLVVAKSGKGTITSAPAGITCGDNCSGANASFTQGASVELTATAAPGYGAPTFKGCDTTTGGKCQIVMNDADSTEEVSVAFAPTNVAVTVTIAGSGSGNVAAEGITCATGNTGDCTESRPFGSTYVLTATPSNGSTFNGWDAAGACAGVRTPQCEITIDQSNAVTATFALKTFRIQSSTSGGFDGASKIVRSPAGAACAPASPDCSTYGFGTNVTLTATPGAGSSFTRWTGDAASCAGNVSCMLTLNADKVVAAEFATKSYRIEVAVTGSGIVKSDEMPTPKLSCASGQSCSAMYTHNSKVTLDADTTVALPPGVAGLRFTGWGGACTGASQCNLTLTADQSVTAAFVNQFAASVTLAGSVNDDATRYVTGPGTFACQGNADPCEYRADAGASITLNATPPPGTIFVGWENVKCAGDPTDLSCTFALASAVKVTARFETPPPAQRMLTLAFAGNGAGGNKTLITATAEGDKAPFLTCGRNVRSCSAPIAEGRNIQIEATPPGWATLQSFSANCKPGTDPNTCALTIQGDHTVTATFASSGNVMFVTDAALPPVWGPNAQPEICVAPAQAAGLDLGGPFIAWFSWSGVIDSPATAAYSAETLGSATLVLVDGTVVSTQGLKGLLSGGPLAPINITQSGTALIRGSPVWTGTTSSGATASTCSNWGVWGDADPATLEGTVGNASAGDSTWTDNGVRTCNQTAHVYCVQDNAAPRP